MGNAFPGPVSQTENAFCVSTMKQAPAGIRFINSLQYMEMYCEQLLRNKPQGGPMNIIQIRNIPLPTASSYSLQGVIFISLLIYYSLYMQIGSGFDMLEEGKTCKSRGEDVQKSRGNGDKEGWGQGVKRLTFQSHPKLEQPSLICKMIPSKVSS